MPDVLAISPTSADLDAAADVLIRAFLDEPGPVFVVPDRAERLRLGSSLARALVRMAARCGAPLVTAVTVRGVALWFSPDFRAPTNADLAETGMAGMPELFGDAAWQRYVGLNNHLDRLHPTYAAEPHWYLALLAVDPDWQRQGIGEALMQPIFEAADRDGLSCYLEAPSERNARFYERRGFTVMGESDVPDSTIHIWHMRREPNL